MKKIILLFLLFNVVVVNGQTCKFHIDLSSCKNDQLSVEFDVPPLGRDTQVYQMASIVPGTYMVSDYSRFVSGFKAFDRDGKRLKVAYCPKENNYRISNSSRLAKISYRVDGTWTSKIQKNPIFQPAGSYFERDYFYLLNSFALFGFLEGYQHLPYEINIIKNENLSCFTSADIQVLSGTQDRITALGYDQLADNPIAYLKPDTVSLKVKNCTFHIAVASRNGVVTSKSLLEALKPSLTKSLAGFFPVFPIEDYYLTFFFAGEQDKAICRNGGIGALEHLKSSVYFAYEMSNPEMLKDFLSHAVVHEFLHVLTPLSLRSEQIYRFNFKKPVMSKHLWLYEGAVEYFSSLAMLQDSVISSEEFIDNIREKITYSKSFPDVSLTDFSRKICEGNNFSEFPNIYNRGALVAFLLDIRLNELTNGQMNLKKLVFNLNDKYAGSYFRDDDLLDEIITSSHPGIKGFIDSCIVGLSKLPIEEYLRKIGYAYYPQKSDSLYLYGKFDVYCLNNKYKVGQGKPAENVFGLSSGDEILAINGVNVKDMDSGEFAGLLMPKEAKSLVLEYSHKGKVFRREGFPRKEGYIRRHSIELDADADTKEIVLRNRVFKKKYG